MTTTRTHFAFRIDLWDSNGENIIEHLAGVEDFPLAMKTYRAACERWPGAGGRAGDRGQPADADRGVDRQGPPVGRGADAARKGARRAVRSRSTASDRGEVAIEAAEHLKRKHPHSEVVVKA